MKIGYILLPIAFVLPAVAATFDFPMGTVAVKLDAPGQNCNDGSQLICITTPTTQRAYLLTVTDDAKFVDEAYRVLLRRPPDVPGQVYWTNRLKGNTITRDQIVDEFMGSAEYRAFR